MRKSQLSGGVRLFAHQPTQTDRSYSLTLLLTVSFITSLLGEIYNRGNISRFTDIRNWLQATSVMQRAITSAANQRFNSRVGRGEGGKGGGSKIMYSLNFK